MRFSCVWAIPKDTEKPADARKKLNRNDGVKEK